MTLVTSNAWNTVAKDIRAVRDDARKRFFADYSAPVKSLGDLEISPSSQISVVQSIAQSANIQADQTVDESIQAALAALSLVGLGLGGPMASVGKTAFDCRNMVTSRLMVHFTNPFDDE